MNDNEVWLNHYLFYFNQLLHAVIETCDIIQATYIYIYITVNNVWEDFYWQTDFMVGKSEASFSGNYKLHVRGDKL